MTASTPTWEVRQGDALDRLREMPDESVHCVVTSPPYWGLRDYGTGEWVGGDPECDHTRQNPREDHSHGDWPGTRGNQAAAANGASPMRATCLRCGAVREDQQVGLESTPEQYVAKIVQVFGEVRRVLRGDGTCWLNLGDSYQSGRGEAQGVDPKSGARRFGKRPQDGKVPGLKPKDLVGIPWRVAFALQADGWWLRCDVIWNKANPMPESVRDRPTKAHEYLFLVTKSPRYFYDAEAIKEPASENTHARGDGLNPKAASVDPGNHHGRPKQNASFSAAVNEVLSTRNKRSVWTTATEPYPEAHFATFPTALVDPCIKAGTSEGGCCPDCGSPLERALGEPKPAAGRGSGNKERKLADGTDSRLNTHIGRSIPWKPTASETQGWGFTCDCVQVDRDGEAPDAPLYPEPVPCTVLDPFAGAGTTLMVALRLGRSAIGIELNPEYVKLAENRIDDDCPLFNRTTT